jgi:hypothetical protein
VTWTGSKEHHSPVGTDNAGQTGGLEVSAEYAINDLPIFVRTGSVVPLRNNLSLTQTVAFSDPLIWSVWPGELVSGGNGTVVEDDGATLRFDTENATAITTMRWSRLSAGADNGIASDAFESSGGGAGSVTASTVFTLSVAPTVGSFDVQCSAETGYEYAGDAADLQDVGIIPSAEECCSSCSTFSNCGYWSWFTDTKRCVLKVSRRGRRVNASAVSGVAPRRMPQSRAHGFQLRAYQLFASSSPTVTINGKPLAEINPADEGKIGWFVQPTRTMDEMGLSSAPPGTLVVLTERIPLTKGLEVKVAVAA